MDFFEYSGFLHQWNWPPRYNWNFVESGVKHNDPNRNVAGVAGFSVLDCLFCFLWRQTHSIHIRTYFQVKVWSRYKTRSVHTQMYIKTIICIKFKIRELIGDLQTGWPAFSMRKKIFLLASSLDARISLCVSPLSFHMEILLYQHGQSALDTSRTLFLLASTQGASCRLVMNHLIYVYVLSQLSC
jgi:hypothetical protein